MSRIKSAGTVPEVLVRRAAHALGFRFRLHRKDLPGKPDLVFPSRRKVVFVHGCFWHQHPGCREGRLPGTNLEYWGPKLSRNVERDCATRLTLRNQGWEQLTIWECETGDRGWIESQLRSFLG